MEGSTPAEIHLIPNNSYFSYLSNQYTNIFLPFVTSRFWQGVAMSGFTNLEKLFIMALLDMLNSLTCCMQRREKKNCHGFSFFFFFFHLDVTKVSKKMRTFDWLQRDIISDKYLCFTYSSNLLGDTMLNVFRPRHF